MMGGCSSQLAMLDVSAAIPDNSFKTSTPFIDIATVQLSDPRCSEVDFCTCVPQGSGETMASEDTTANKQKVQWVEEYHVYAP